MAVEADFAGFEQHDDGLGAGGFALGGGDHFDAQVGIGDVEDGFDHVAALVALGEDEDWWATPLTPRSPLTPLAFGESTLSRRGERG